MFSVVAGHLLTIQVRGGHRPCEQFDLHFSHLVFDDPILADGTKTHLYGGVLVPPR